MKCYTVIYKADSCDQNARYFKRQNRYGRSESFDTIAEANRFAEQVNGEVYYLGNRV